MNYSNPNPFLFCDEIYCMGLRTNKYRRDRAQKQFEYMGIDVTWINAIKNHKYPRKGCLQTHQMIFKMAREKGHKNILIFEDDVKFVHLKEKTYQVLLDAIVDLPDNYGALYLGIRWGTPGMKISDNLTSVVSGKLCHAVIFNESVFWRIIKSANKSFDRCMVEEIQPLQSCYCTNIELAVQNG